MLQPGTQIGRYEIQRKLARGGMGTVYVAHDPILGRMVALKVFLGDLDVPDAGERFSREARAAASLNHTNIVTVYDFGEVESQPYIVMEYIQGETMAEIIRRRTSVPLAEKLLWLEELCAGVGSAHKMDVVHRDIKPGNLMIDRSGRLKILDFGIAKIVNSLATSMTAVIGTPGYMAPEQLLGHGVDARTDLFSIGVVAFEVLTYEEAFQGDSFTSITHQIVNEEVRRVSHVVAGVPEDLCDLVEKSLKKDPADRFQDAESMRIALSRVRRRIETTTDFDSSAGQTIVSPMAVPARKSGTGPSGKAASAGVRAAALTPPLDPAAEREAVARARAIKIGAALQRADGCFHNGEFDRALAACQEVLTLDPGHEGASALQKHIAAEAARRRAVLRLADAREELGRGALTRCRSLLDEARQLDPDARDEQLERDLRLARVEHERLRHRTDTAQRTIAAARAALDRGDAEAALACAREALALDQNLSEAQELELAALRVLDAEDDSRRTAVAPTEEPSAEDKTVVAALPPTRARPAAPQPATSAPMPVAAPPPVLPTPAAVPAPSKAQVDSGTHAASSGAGTRAQRAHPLAAIRARLAAVPVDRWLAHVRGAATQAAARARALPPRQRGLAAAVALALLMGIAAVALWRPSPPPVVTGTLVIEASPWAEITAIRGEDGRNRLDAPATTPLQVTLPVGAYTIALSGPPPDSAERSLTVKVAAAQVTVAPAAVFQAPTAKEYFDKYFGGDAASPPDAAAGGLGETPAGPVPTPEAAAPPPASPSPSQPRGVVP